ncbi:MAG: hypothetical protein ABI602_04845 [Candidatus Saccharibacteria bacterium]
MPSNNKEMPGGGRQKQTESNVLYLPSTNLNAQDNRDTSFGENYADNASLAEGVLLAVHNAGVLSIAGRGVRGKLEESRTISISELQLRREIKATRRYSNSPLTLRDFGVQNQAEIVGCAKTVGSNAWVIEEVTRGLVIGEYDRTTDTDASLNLASVTGYAELLTDQGREALDIVIEKTNREALASLVDMCQADSKKPLVYERTNNYGVTETGTVYMSSRADFCLVVNECSTSNPQPLSWLDATIVVGFPEEYTDPANNYRELDTL